MSRYFITKNQWFFFLHTEKNELHRDLSARKLLCSNTGIVTLLNQKHNLLQNTRCCVFSQVSIHGVLFPIIFLTKTV